MDESLVGSWYLSSMDVSYSGDANHPLSPKANAFSIESLITETHHHRPSPGETGGLPTSHQPKIALGDLIRPVDVASGFEKATGDFGFCSRFGGFEKPDWSYLRDLAEGKLKVELLIFNIFFLLYFCVKNNRKLKNFL